MTGTTTVMVTHDTEEAWLMADRLAILHRGTVQQIDTPAELYRHPATVQVAELLGMHNILAVRSQVRCCDDRRRTHRKPSSKPIGGTFAFHVQRATRLWKFRFSPPVFIPGPKPNCPATAWAPWRLCGSGNDDD